MSTQTMIHDLRNPCGEAFDKEPCEETRPARLSGAALRTALTRIAEFLFARSGEEEFRRAEGEKMTPVVVYKHVGMGFVQPSVWEAPRR